MPLGMTIRSTLTLFTNGPSTLTRDQEDKLRMKNLPIVEDEIEAIAHHAGQIQHIAFKDGTSHPVSTVFTRVLFEQHCHLPQEMGCVLTQDGFIETDNFRRTNIAGVNAAGDNTSPFRTLSLAVAAGSLAGAFINKELIDEGFLNK